MDEVGARNQVVAVAGATGAVGVEMLKCLEKRNFPLASLEAARPKRSAGTTMRFRARICR